jgi:hypothetical protein
MVAGAGGADAVVLLMMIAAAADSWGGGQDGDSDTSHSCTVLLPVYHKANSTNKLTRTQALPKDCALTANEQGGHGGT